jgi:hypothetical protein
VTLQIIKVSYFHHIFKCNTGCTVFRTSPLHCSPLHNATISKMKIVAKNGPNVHLWVTMTFCCKVEENCMAGLAREHYFSVPTATVLWKVYQIIVITGAWIWVLDVIIAICCSLVGADTGAASSGRTLYLLLGSRYFEVSFNGTLKGTVSRDFRPSIFVVESNLISL